MQAVSVQGGAVEVGTGSQRSLSRSSSDASQKKSRGTRRESLTKRGVSPIIKTLLKGGSSSTAQSSEVGRTIELH